MKLPDQHAGTNGLLAAVTFILTLLCGILAVNLHLGSYAREADFLPYRLASNLRDGHGLVYNPDENVLLIFSPLPVLPLAIEPDDAHHIAAALAVGAYALAAAGLIVLLRRAGLSRVEAGAALAIVLLAWPAWAGFRSPAPITLALAAASLLAMDTQRYRLAGLLAGTAVLMQPAGMIALVALGLYSARVDYWKTVWIPGALWGLLAVIVYSPDGLAGLGSTATAITGGWRDFLWLGLFFAALPVLKRVGLDPRLWVFPLWAGLDVGAHLLFYGHVPQIESLPLALTAALGLTLGARLAPTRWRLPALSLMPAGAAVLLVFFPPHTPPALAAEIALGRSLHLAAATSIAHDQGDALAYYIDGFRGAVYRLDGRRSPQLASFVERHDTTSLLVLTAPDYVLLAAAPDPSQPDFETESLYALRYEPVPQTSTRLFVRRAPVGLFEAPLPSGLSFSPDVRLASFALDRARPEPGDVLRVRLDWTLARAPEQAIGLIVNLVGIDGQPVASIFPTLPVENWQPLAVSTYHALAVPEDAPFGIYRIEVTMDYRAGILGRRAVATVAVPPPAWSPDQAVVVGNLGGVSIFMVEPEITSGDFRVNLIWNPTARLDREYQVFAHLTTQDTLTPLVQADGPPAGGRYPTTFWQPGEYIPDTRSFDVSNLPPGRYRINVGLYAIDGARLRGTNGDYVTVVAIDLDSSGRVVPVPLVASGPP